MTGYHHETYAFPLGDADFERPARCKVREPRSGLLWFDRRCFDSEEQLLRALAGRVTRVPALVRAGDMELQRFIEGETLGARHPSGTVVPPAMSDQIMDLFRELASISSDTLAVARRCEREDRVDDGDTAAFIERLITFTEERIYDANSDKFAALFGSFGLDSDSFKCLRQHVLTLSERPFCLLHADLHRENFIVDHENQLWIIDWELAMIGDPLYELATHLYWMRYPVDQERRVIQQWCATVEEVRPGSASGWERDLPLVLDYRKAQSVFADIIRLCLSLDVGRPVGVRSVLRGATEVRKLLTLAAQPLGLGTVPSVAQISNSLLLWHREHGVAWHGDDVVAFKGRAGVRKVRRLGAWARRVRGVPRARPGSRVR